LEYISVHETTASTKDETLMLSYYNLIGGVGWGGWVMGIGSLSGN